MPFRDRPHELALFMPLVLGSMLELGNKRNGLRTYKSYFESLGLNHVSVDLNGEDGALPLDLRQPLRLGTFSMISNIGTTEHVADQEPVWRNIAEAMDVGSVLVSITPLPGDWPGHGEWYPERRFYEEFARANGMITELLYEHGSAPRRCVMARLRRVRTCPFSMPTGLIARNA